MSSNITKLTAKLKALPDQQSAFEKHSKEDHVLLEPGCLGQIDAIGFSDLITYFATIAEDAYRRGFQQGVELAVGDSGNGKYTAKDLAAELRYKGHYNFQLLDTRPGHTLHRFLAEAEKFGISEFLSRYDKERKEYLMEGTEDLNDSDERALAYGMKAYLKNFADSYLQDREPELLQQLGRDDLIKN